MGGKLRSLLPREFSLMSFYHLYNQTRIVATEGIAKLAFHFASLRSQVGHLFTRAEPSSLTSSGPLNSPAVSWIASPSLHLMELASETQDRSGFLSLPPKECHITNEAQEKVKVQMNLFGLGQQQ